MLRLLLALLALSAPLHAQTLLGRATLPADTFIPGPTSGAAIESANGVSVPFVDKQSVQGFSSLQAAPGGDLWALSDNGFGSKANSADFLLRVHRLGRDFQTARGGSGRLFVKDTIILRDPNRKAGFPIVNENTSERRLTGADFDPESLAVASDGTWWVGDEFGPFILHFSSDGTLLEKPFAIEGVASPDDPLGRPATINRSKGFEGLAESKGGGPGTFYGMLEGSVEGDDPRDLRLYVLYLDVPMVAAYWKYQLEDEGHSIGELAPLPNGKYLVIERDSLQGDAAKFKKIYEIDTNKPDKNGYLRKRERADLLNIADPDKIASAGVFRFPFQTIESVLPLDNDRVIVMNDNNYPFSSGRTAGKAEDTEAIVIRLKP